MWDRGPRAARAARSLLERGQPASRGAETVAALDEAGAEEVWLGVEFGSQRILDGMEKGTRIEQVRSATRTLKAQGIRSCWFVQLGYVGEEWDDIVLTRDLIREEQPDEIGVSVSYPLPGTLFYQAVRTQLETKHNWEQSDDLEMLFHGTYTTEFYRRVRAALHDEVDALRRGDGPLHQRWAELRSSQAEHKNPVALDG